MVSKTRAPWRLVQAIFGPRAKGDLKVDMVAMGEATNARQITHPFSIYQGWTRIDFSVSDAEHLCVWLTAQLGRDDVRRTRTITRREALDAPST